MVKTQDFRRVSTVCSKISQDFPRFFQDFHHFPKIFHVFSKIFIIFPRFSTFFPRFATLFPRFSHGSRGAIFPQKGLAGKNSLTVEDSVQQAVSVNDSVPVPGKNLLGLEMMVING